jgi:Fe-S cluster biogenesis protein NfuA
MNNGEFQAHAERIERLVEQVTALPDEDARNKSLELLQSLMDLHGEASARIVELLSEGGEAGRSSLTKLGKDPLICGLLVLYGVHPVPLEARVAEAVEKVGPQLRKLSGSVELLGIADAVVRVKIESSGHGCGSSPDKVKLAIEQAILEAAPEVVEVIAEGLPTSASGFVPINMVQAATQKEEKAYEESTA